MLGDTEVNDFRSLLDGDGKKKTDKAKYVDNSLQARFGFTNPIVKLEKIEQITTHLTRRPYTIIRY